MKELFLKSTKTLVIMAALFGVITLNSCKDDEEVTPAEEELVEDGFYIQGPSSAYAGYDIKATLSSTRNEVLQEDRATLLEIFVALKAGDGFNIMQVAGNERTSWGPGTDWASAMGGNEEPQVDIQRGAIATTSTRFTVPTDGLYQVVIDTETGKGAVVPVEWGFIGQSTPGGWSGDTKFDAPAFDMTTMTWSLTGVEMGGGEWKFRYSGGWKVEIDTTIDLGDGKKGIKFNTNFGNDAAGAAFAGALVPGGDNYTDASGVYDVSMTWTAGSGHTAVYTKTGDLPARDFSAVEVGLIGDGVQDGNWDGELFATTPAKDGDVYTWAYNGVQLASAGGFKLRTAGTWDDINEGYSDIVTGPSASDIQDNGGNMQAKADGTYDIVFTIDAAAETKSISFTKK
ncbi:hypothetical protein OAJ52_01320 [Bacteroidia bacterium]|jgi:hypothetical protein|nr:hypothetical protein [Bacteroidia bacterium]|tara:strand:- start:979 stop:2175 length:1197 start_codon:yes stop_codon:yes gene_type:complete